ncbi:MAG: RNHCP domain-containing protein [Oscillospiraceae bacterium]|nr:RNHCP domain-containing protein [Oscillospiraceae bacterium]
MRKFTVIDEGFTCRICGRIITPLGSGCRNHCNHCLSSLHLDNNPGDRASDCGGILRPVGIETGKGKKALQIVHKCEKCGEIKKNIAAGDDNYDLIVELSAIAVKQV